MREGDFSESVKHELAYRAGHRCSMPSCRAPTSGSSDTRSSGASNIGVAAHIHAASRGGPRYDPKQTSGERNSIENGIWLCQTDAKRIDDDEARFQSDLLVRWKHLAEERASRELGKADSHVPLAERGIVSLRRALSTSEDDQRFEVDDFLTDIGGRTAWHEKYDLIRMAIFELALNAVKHGGAVELFLESSEGAVSLEADGQAFSHTRLHGSGGGAVAIAHLSDPSNGAFSIRFQGLNEVGRWTIVDEVIAGGANTPCSIAPSSPREFPDRDTVKRLKALAGCEHIHVYPGRLWSYSDWFMLLRTAAEVLPGMQLVLHGLGRESSIAGHISENFEGVRVAD